LSIELVLLMIVNLHLCYVMSFLIYDKFYSKIKFILMIGWDWSVRPLNHIIPWCWASSNSISDLYDDIFNGLLHWDKKNKLKRIKGKWIKPSKLKKFLFEHSQAQSNLWFLLILFKKCKKIYYFYLYLHMRK